VAAIDVGVQLIEQVALIRNALQAAVPEVVVGIANRQLRLERLLGRQSVPVIASERHKSLRM
jgi:dephospho-CoA kinase